MQPLGPFEPAPRVAVAVSGGPDSLALCLLADRWAQGRAARSARSPSTTACALNRGPKPPRCGAGWLAAAFRIGCSDGRAPHAAAPLRRRRAPRASRFSPAGAGGPASSTCCWATSGRIRPRPRFSDSSTEAVSRGSPPWRRFAWRSNLTAPASACSALCFPCREMHWPRRCALESALDRRPVQRRHPPRAPALRGSAGAVGLGRAERGPLARVAARAADDRATLDRLCTELLAACAHPAPAGL